MSLDCQSCGACCHNPEANRREGFRDWVEVDERDELLKHRGASRLVVYNRAGECHMRLDGDRCAALRGRLGEKVWCSIYEIRPRVCRRVEAGSQLCHKYRRERHLE